MTGGLKTILIDLAVLPFLRPLVAGILVTSSAIHARLSEIALLAAAWRFPDLDFCLVPMVMIKGLL